MIKTLRITGVVVAILAGVLIKFLVLPMVTNVARDLQVEGVLDSNSVVERFKETKGAHAKSTGNKTSPLVLQATAYARYLDPPARVRPPVTGGGRGLVKPPIIGPTTPKFTVFATTVFESNPELSQALIDEPGRGRHWVRQSSMVGHLLIEQVKDGVVIVKSSKETFELEIEKASTTGLSKGKSPLSKGIGGRSGYSRTVPVSGKTPYSPTRTSSVRTPSARTPSRTPARTPSRTLRPSSNGISSEKAGELFSKLEDLQRSHRLEKSASGVDGEEMAARIGRLLDTFKSPGAGAENAKGQTASGADSKGNSQEANKTSSASKTGKVGTVSAKPDAPMRK